MLFYINFLEKYIIAKIEINLKVIKITNFYFYRNI